MRTLDQSHRALVERVGGDVAEGLRVLPHSLGVSPHSPGSFSDFARLEPMVDLPGLVALSGVSDLTLDWFRYAHHVGGFLGLTLDRLADGQTRRRDLAPEVAALEAEWVRALSSATGDRSKSEALAREVLADLQRGLAMESVAFVRGDLDLERYGEIVWLKTRWLALPSRMMLEGADVEGTEALAAFDEAYRWLMLSLQVADDGADAEQDRARMGRSMPELLKIHPSTLLACAAPITRRAAEAARGHPRLRAWCEARAVEVEAAFRVERRRTMAAGLVVMGLSAAVDARRGRRP
ncbi:MAG: hypothetical protein SangKO_050160 [Sandaracinaceae bacterium]